MFCDVMYINYSLHMIYDLQMHVISVLVTNVTQNSNTEVFTDTIPHQVLKNLNNTNYSIYLETHYWISQLSCYADEKWLKLSVITM